MTQPHGPSRARQLATMRQPIHPDGLATIIERRPRRPLPTPVRQGPLPRYGFVIAVVAAHDAEHRLAATLESLDAQTRRPDAVIVVADRCNDATVVTALVHGATVVETKDNPHGRAGALNLALREVLALVDDDDAVLMVGDGVVVAPRFVASGLAELWAATPTPPRRRWRRAPRTPGIILSTTAAAPRRSGRTPQPGGVLRPVVGNGWPGRRSTRGTDATLSLAGALRGVAATRQARVQDPANADVLDVTSPCPTTELAIALDALGYGVLSPERCLTTTATATTPHPSHVLDEVRRTQHATLTAVGRRGALRRTRRAMFAQGALVFEIAAPVVAAVTVLAALATGGPALPLTAVLGVAALAWAGERAWAVRHAGRQLGSELGRGLARSAAAATGAVAGTWRWLAALRLRRNVWRHPTSARVLARRRPPFGSPGDVALVRVGGAAIAIERSGPAPDVVAERWRQRALAASAGALALVVMIGLPLALPVPFSVVVGVWALSTAGVSVVRFGRTVGRRRSGG